MEYGKLRLRRLLVQETTQPTRQSHHSFHFTELVLIQVFALYSDEVIVEEKHQPTIGY